MNFVYTKSTVEELTESIITFSFIAETIVYVEGYIKVYILNRVVIKVNGVN